MLAFGRALDYAALVLASFFAPDAAVAAPVAAPDAPVLRPRPTLLLFYFLSPEMRGVMYAGLAARILANAVGGDAASSPPSFITASRAALVTTVSFLSVTAFLNIAYPNFKLFPAKRKGPGRSSDDGDDEDDDRNPPTGTYRSWRTTASDGLGWMGAWWVGAGNGDWFAFVGHNGQGEKTILPSSILEQMSVDRNATDDPNVVEINEL